MTVNLTMQDLVTLANTSKLDKDGLTLTIQRPVLTKIVGGGPNTTKWEATFYLDDSDPRSKDAMAKG